VEGKNVTQPEPIPLPRRFKLAGLLIATGLAVEAVTLLWRHPTAFLAFTGFGVSLVAVGVLVYLYSLAAPDRSA
jgi:hypothetical protein